MKYPDDETLMAFADGALDRNTAKNLEAKIRENPQLQARLRVFLDTGAPIRNLFAVVSEEPPPGRLVRLITDHPAVGSSQSTVWWTSRIGHGKIVAALKNFIPLHSPTQIAIIGTTLAFIFGVGLGSLFTLRETSSNSEEIREPHIAMGEVSTKNPIALALQRNYSGDQAIWRSVSGTQLSFMPVLSFRSRDGRFCRQFQLSGISLQGVSGVACKQKNGRWSVEVAGTANVPSKDRNGVYPASNQQSRYFEATVDQMMADIALDKIEETKLIKKGWKK